MRLGNSTYKETGLAGEIMAIEVKKFVDGVEYLPDVVDTPLWDLINPDKFYRTKKSDRQIARLYEAIAKRENYFQEYSPTAFGNPDYERIAGTVDGILVAMEAYETEANGQIVIRMAQSGKKILVVDKVKRPKSYFEEERENKELREAFGIGNFLGL